MLVQPPIEKLLPKTENRYTLAIAVAKRARQLVDGANPLIDEEQLDSPSLVSLAAEELSENQIAALPGILDPTIPLRPEILQAQAMQREEEEEDGFELLRQDLEAKAPEEPEEPEAPRSMVRELRDDELFELPNDLEREFFENFGDLDAEMLPMTGDVDDTDLADVTGDATGADDADLEDLADVDETDLSDDLIEDEATKVTDEEAPTDVTIKKSAPRTPAEDDEDEDSESLFGDDLDEDDVDMINDDLEAIDSSIDDVRDDNEVSEEA